VAPGDELIGIDGDAIIVWRGDAVVRHEVTSGKERTLASPAGELGHVGGEALLGPPGVGAKLSRNGIRDVESDLCHVAKYTWILGLREGLHADPGTSASVHDKLLGRTPPGSISAGLSWRRGDDTNSSACG